MTRSSRDLASQSAQLRKQQERLLSDLLTVMDGLDRAADHWGQARTNLAVPAPSDRHEAPGVMARCWQALMRRLGLLRSQSPPTDESLPVVIANAHDGISMIRESLLEVLSRQQVVPVEALGQPFDPAAMLALGRRSQPAVAANTVVKEVVRGYRWREKLLREAQVILASPSSPTSSPPSSPSSS
jgi:molecular chaperone GrpE (heat shock protein)